jgi:hypothetical protein
MTTITIRRSFDGVLERLAASATTLSEAELLEHSHWQFGQDARLREDVRLRETPWGRWMRSEDLLANQALYDQLHAAGHSGISLQAGLEQAGLLLGRRCVVCLGDGRFVLEGSELRLAARELGDRPRIEGEIGELEKYTSHLPLHTLVAAAASMPAATWSRDTQEQMIETLGWIRVSTNSRLNPRMFVACIQGHSMDDGHSRLVDGSYVIFELWPTGTRQHQKVLVRGSFCDPETGSYAVKKYVAEERDAEGRPHRITLVSLNPDKQRYPNIELEAEDEDAVTVVARVVHALQPSEYARLPKPRARRGRRDLASDEGLRGIYQRLADHAERFFATSAHELGDAPRAKAQGWNSQLVCLEAKSGGLQLELGPLPGMWSFVKILVARASSGHTVQMLASNARLRPVRTPVLPSCGAWAWSAQGFEDDPDVDLSALGLAGLPHDRAMAFGVGADGVGRILSGNQLSPGQHYRLLIPPELWHRAAPGLVATTLADDWSLVELSLDIVIAPELEHALAKLGFGMGGPTPTLGFTLANWPDEWRVTPHGEPFACFAPGRTILLDVDGYDGEVEGEARLFVHGPHGARSLALPAGNGTVAGLAELDPGQYLISVIHQRTRVQPVYLPLAIDEIGSTSIPAARFRLQIAGSTHDSQPNQRVRTASGDLAEMERWALTLEGPPGWPIRVRWREFGDDYLTSLQFDEMGQLDVEMLLSSTRERRQRRLVGDLILDLRELGTVILEHDRRPSPEALAAALREFVHQRAETVRLRRGAFVQLLPMWFVPVGRWLNYQVDVITEDFERPPPTHAAAARLVVTERRAQGISRRCKRILIMLEVLEPSLTEGLLAWIDELCLRHDTDSALISTGLEWASHRRRSRLPLQIWNLPNVLDHHDNFIAFLREFAEGI